MSKKGGKPKVILDGYGGIRLLMSLRDRDGWKNITSLEAQEHGPGVYHESLAESIRRIYRIDIGSVLRREETGLRVTVKEIYGMKMGAMVDMFFLAEDENGDSYAVDALSMSLKWRREE